MSTTPVLTPLFAPPALLPRRVRYREGQFLLAEDLNDEQRYRIAMRRRHSIGLHVWGIVTGLNLSVRCPPEKPSVVRLAPGVACDGYGRALVVPSAVEFEIDALKTRFPQSDSAAHWALDLWLEYRRDPGPLMVEAGQVSPVHDRWIESAIIVGDAANNWIPPVRPPSSVVFDDPPLAHDEPPDDPERPWPVYLGRLVVELVQDGQEKHRLDRTNRPYAGLVASAVWAPSGLARMEFGGEQSAGRRAFAVSLREEPDQSGQEAGDQAAYIDALVINRAGRARIAGDMLIAALPRPAKEASNRSSLQVALSPALLRASDFRNPADEELLAELNADLNKSNHEPGAEPPAVPVSDLVRSRRAELEERLPDLIACRRRHRPVPYGIGFDRARPAPEQPAPWRIYRAAVTGEGDPPPRHDELRFELFDPGKEGDPANYQLVVGSCPAQEHPTEFTPCLAVRADGTLVLYGNLEVHGKLLQGPIQPDFEDPRFVEAYFEQWAAGLGAVLDATAGVPLEVTVDRNTINVVNGRLEYKVDVKLPSGPRVSGILLYTSFFVSDGDETKEHVRIAESDEDPSPLPFSLEPGDKEPLDVSSEIPPDWTGPDRKFAVAALGDVGAGESTLHVL